MKCRTRPRAQHKFYKEWQGILFMYLLKRRHFILCWAIFHFYNSIDIDQRKIDIEGFVAQTWRFIDTLLQKRQAKGWQGFYHLGNHLVGVENFQEGLFAWESPWRLIPFWRSCRVRTGHLGSLFHHHQNLFCHRRQQRWCHHLPLCKDYSLHREDSSKSVLHEKKNQEKKSVSFSSTTLLFTLMTQSQRVSGAYHPWSTIQRMRRPKYRKREITTSTWAIFIWVMSYFS